MSVDDNAYRVQIELSYADALTRLVHESSYEYECMWFCFSKYFVLVYKFERQPPTRRGKSTREKTRC